MKMSYSSLYSQILKQWLLHNKHSANTSGFYKISVVTTGASTIHVLFLFFLDSGTNLITKNILIIKNITDTNILITK